MVDALASDRSDQPFGEAVLPRRAWGGGLVTDAHGAQPACDGSAVDSIPIPDQVARSLIPREYFCDLTCDPVRGRIRCGVDPDKVPAGQPNDDKDIEQIEPNGRNNEQVHGADVRCVFTQEGPPSLGRGAASLDHVLRDARLSDLETAHHGYVVLPTTDFPRSSAGSARAGPRRLAVGLQGSAISAANIFGSRPA